MCETNSFGPINTSLSLSLSLSVLEEYGVALCQKLQISLTVKEIHICHYLQHVEYHSGLSVQLSRLSDQGGMLIDTVHNAH